MSADVDVAIAAVEAGAAVVRGMYGTAVGRHAKSTTDFATDADLAAERAILEVIEGARPGDAFVGEEYGARGDSSRRWLVDPLCGTLNFAARTPLFSVNVALQIDGETAVAAVADPSSGEIFWTDGTTAAIRRNGSDSPGPPSAESRSDSPITPSAESRSDSPTTPSAESRSDFPMTPSAESRLVDVNLDPITDGSFLGSRLLTDDAFRKTFAQRVLSTTLPVAWVAAGRRAAYVTDGTLRDSVHFTAGLALCLAAGCVVTDLRGNPLYSGNGVIAAADAATHTALLEIVARHLPAD